MTVYKNSSKQDSAQFMYTYVGVGVCMYVTRTYVCWQSSNNFRQVWTNSDKFRQIQTNFNKIFRNILTSLNFWMTVYKNSSKQDSAQ